MSKPVASQEFIAARAARPLTGKVALVTGGSRGIGAAIAKELADQGADVAISYAASADKANAVSKELESKGVRAAAFKADQADAHQVEALVKTVAKEFGRIDILVNNACVFAGGAINDSSADRAALERLFAVNVGGVTAAVRAAVPFKAAASLPSDRLLATPLRLRASPITRQPRRPSPATAAAGRVTSAPRASP
jgi:NAD(P)-dependent dehydrogenase (short-subunit alcohol dehydrogenase family)